jgi:gas vesicle protein
MPRLCDNGVLEDSMRRFMAFLTGSLCGALMGAVAALLLAPYSGGELRQRTRERLDTFRDDIREAYDARREQLEAELESLRRPPSA